MPRGKEKKKQFAIVLGERGPHFSSKDGPRKQKRKKKWRKGEK